MLSEVRAKTFLWERSAREARRVRVYSKLRQILRPSPNPLPEGEGFIDLVGRSFDFMCKALTVPHVQPA